MTVLSAALALHSGARAADWRSAPPDGLRSGDLAFRKGDGLWTRFFVDFSTREKRFSHVGVVVIGESGEIEVVHAEGDDFTGKGSVRKDPWHVFFDGVPDGAVYRCEYGAETSAAVASAALSRLGVPFDTDFDLSSGDRLYCTELVRVAVNSACGREVVGTTCVKGRELVALDDVYATGFKKIFDSANSDSLPSPD